VPELTEFVPIFNEDADSIRARMFADVNAGLNPDDPAFLDTTPGGFLWDLSGASVLEIERLWDAVGSEMVAACFPAYAWGTYLDEHALTLGMVRKDAVPATGEVTFAGDEGALIATGTEVSTLQTTPEGEPVSFETTQGGTIPAGGTLTLPVQAAEAGTEGNVAAGTVTLLQSPLDGISSVTNAQPMQGGADIESDEQLRNRVLLAYSGSQGSGTITDYQAWSLAYPGVGFVAVVPQAAGAGTVGVIVTDADNRPVPTATVAGLQEQLDPVPGEGRGQAPIGAKVTVSTPTTQLVDVAAQLVLEEGFSVGGAGGTIDVAPDVQAAVRRYIDKLAPGEDVVRLHAIATAFEVPGVEDVAVFTLDDGTGPVSTNIVIAADEVAQADAVAVTEAP
jgi:uncharacterized phage protein gp47/JayE